MGTITMSDQELVQALEQAAKDCLTESEALIAHAQTLRAKATELMGADVPVENVPVENAAVVEVPEREATPTKPPDAERVSSLSGRSVGSQGAITPAKVVEAAERLGRFRRKALEDELGLSGTATMRWIGQLLSKRYIREDGREFVYVPPKDTAPPEGRQEAVRERPARQPGERTVTHAGPEALPEDLRWLPGARLNVAVGTRLKVARQQKAVWEALDAVKPAVPSEVMRALPEPTMNLQKVGELLRDMSPFRMDDGAVVFRTGRRRHDKNKAGVSGPKGRLAIEYTTVKPEASPTPMRQAEAKTEEAKPPEAKPPAEAEPEAKRGPDEASKAKAAEALSKVRGYAEKQRNEFSPRQVAEATEVALPLVIATLEELAHRSVVEDCSVGDDLRLFKFLRGGPVQRVQDPKVKRGQQVPNGRVKASNREVQATLDSAAKYVGWDSIRHAANGHFEIKNPKSGEKVLIAATPRNTRSIMNDRTRVRRIIPEMKG